MKNIGEYRFLKAMEKGQEEVIKNINQEILNCGSGKYFDGDLTKEQRNNKLVNLRIELKFAEKRASEFRNQIGRIEYINPNFKK